MYRNFHTYFWSDPKIKKWPAMARYQFLYFFTNEHSHMSGIYRLKIPYMVEDLAIPKKTVMENLTLFKKENVVQYDYDREIVWVVKMLFHQTHGNPGENNLKAIAKHLGTLHNTPLIEAFLLRYKDLGIGYRHLSDAPSIGHGIGTVSVPDTDSVSDERDSKGEKGSRNQRIHIDKLDLTEAMRSYASQHGVTKHVTEVFSEMARWAHKNNKPTNTPQGWNAQFQTFIKNVPKFTPELLDTHPEKKHDVRSVRHVSSFD